MDEDDYKDIDKMDDDEYKSSSIKITSSLDNVSFNTAELDQYSNPIRKYKSVTVTCYTKRPKDAIK
jgi:hypothetical protein